MNPSHGPENVVKAGSKFNRMKQKLQVKVDGDKAGLHQEKDVLEERPIASQLPPEHPPAGENEGNPPAAMHDRNLPGNEDDTRPAVVKKKNESNFNRASPMKIVRVCKAMSPAQQNLISKSDFRDIIQMKCSKLNPELCRFLMSSFDPIKCELDFGDRGKIPVTEESVFKVMGVHMGGSTVLYHLDVDATSLILEIAWNSGWGAT